MSEMKHNNEVWITIQVWNGDAKNDLHYLEGGSSLIKEHPMLKVLSYRTIYSRKAKLKTPYSELL